MLRRRTDYSENQMKLAEKYIKLWKIYVHTRRKSHEILSKYTQLNKKIFNFLIEVEQGDGGSRGLGNSKTLRHRGEVYEKRFLAQKQIIENQKTVITNQIKLIEELKINQESKLPTGQMTYEVDQNALVSTTPPKSIPQLEVHPIIKKMKEREEERRQHRAFFEMKKREKEKYMTEKLQLQEEERKRKELEYKRSKMREKKEAEKRRKEEEAARHKEREFCLALEMCALKLKDRLLCRKILTSWRGNTESMHCMKRKCINELSKSILISIIRDWRAKTILIRFNLFETTKYLEESRLITICWRAWALHAKESLVIKSTALEWFFREVKLEVFRKWDVFAKKRTAEMRKLITIMESVYERILLHRAITLWRMLPDVMYKERETEKRLREWENKVKSILPDYNLECLQSTMNV